MIEFGIGKLCMYVRMCVCVHVYMCMYVCICMYVIIACLFNTAQSVCMYVMRCNRGADIGGVAEAFPREEDFEERIAIAL
jgi:hypothetical protein